MSLFKDGCCSITKEEGLEYFLKHIKPKINITNKTKLRLIIHIMTLNSFFNIPFVHSISISNVGRYNKPAL